MAKFNRKAAIAALDNSKFIKKFEDNLEPINGGWVIYWKGKPVKPIGGNRRPRHGARPRGWRRH